MNTPNKARRLLVLSLFAGVVLLGSAQVEEAVDLDVPGLNDVRDGISLAGIERESDIPLPARLA